MRVVVLLAAGVASRGAARLAAIAIAIVLITQPIATAVASGWQLDRTCCCPDLKDCKCPHGNGGNTAPIARTCGDAGHVVLPIETMIVTPSAAPVLIAPAPTVVVALELPAPKPAPPIEIETPPF